MRIYADVVIGLNFLVDFLLLMAADRLSGYPATVKRWALGAAVGAAYSGLCLAPGLYFLAGAGWRMVFLALMALTAFGWNGSALRRGLVFMLLSMALGGLAMGFGGMEVNGLILAAVGLWALCRFGVGTVGDQTYVPVTLRREGRELKVLALRDTGNTLRDPISGEPVLVAGADVAQELLGLTAHQLAHPVETMAKGAVPGLRLIPYHSVGQSAGLLLALRMKDAQVGKRRGDVMVAFAPEEVGRGEMYRMLTGGMI